MIRVFSILVAILGSVAAFYVVKWAWLDAAFTGAAQDCKAVAGACWPVVTTKARLLAFGLYPQQELWRAGAALTILAILPIVTWCKLWLGAWRLLGVWGVGITVSLTLLWGGIFGLEAVPSRNWGGVLLTLILSYGGLALAYPLGIVIALMRTSDWPVYRFLGRLYVELVRGVPLVSILFLAMVLFPLFLPSGVDTGQLLRALVAFALFVAAYMAEVVRGGLQSLPSGQIEAARSVGLGYWQTYGFVLLPQALKRTLPAQVNVMIGAFKDTSLVLVVGLLDAVLAAKTALADAPWRTHFIEIYLVLAVFYFIYCQIMKSIADKLEAA